MPNINIENKTSYEIDEDFFSKVILEISLLENFNPENEINLTFVESEEIKDLNNRFRGNNKATDVLSFPAEIPGVPFLGDIIIDISYAEKQKGENSLKFELQTLFVHGVFHLLGYDHISVKQKKIMNQKEDFIIAKIKGE